MMPRAWLLQILDPVHATSLFVSFVLDVHCQCWHVMSFVYIIYGSRTWGGAGCAGESCARLPHVRHHKVDNKSADTSKQQGRS